MTVAITMTDTIAEKFGRYLGHNLGTTFNNEQIFVSVQSSRDHLAKPERAPAARCFVSCDMDGDLR